MERLEHDARYWAGLRGELTSELRDWIPVFFRDLPPADAQTIQALVQDGKKLRGSIVLAVCEALGGSRSRAMPSAVAIECVHSASLIHDDFVDSDRTRRDAPALWMVHGSRRAVLLADVIFATALQRSAEVGREEVLTLAGAIAKVAAGAYKEPLDPTDLHTPGLDAAAARSLYERIIHLKTGALFAAAAELGAIAADASPALRKAAGEFGARTGEAYQMADDLNDVASHAASPLLTTQQKATLTTLLTCFDVRRGRRDSAAAARDELLGAMEAAIGTHVARARDALQPFGDRAAKLLAFPRLIVEPIVPSRKTAPEQVTGEG
jgi:geranylgeranyl pyrophosphate synthase